MPLQSLGYVGVAGTDSDEWISYATKFLGMQLGEKTARAVTFRVDERLQRFFIEFGTNVPQRVFGWEVANGADLHDLAARLEARGVKVVTQPDLAARRGVRDVIVFNDPDGNRLEAFYGPEVATTPFQPGRAISGFRTGGLGLGHVVITSEQLDALTTFYREFLGFRLSDFTNRPFRANFFHLNPRHHSLAVIEGPKSSLHHVMLELFSIDDVGQAYDLAQLAPDRINVTLGRHSNDFMMSFYARCPSGFMIEYGWGGRLIDPETWKPEELRYGPSLWGHERNWLPEADRNVARTMRMEAGVDGIRAPVFVMKDYSVVTAIAGLDENVRKNENL
jgi:2,3-dihydroxybiphenyl 1,2-dioxygenase